MSLAWLPLLVLALVDGRAWDGVRVPFLLDVQVQAQLLVALPLLIATQTFTGGQVPAFVGEFVAREMIPDAARARFDAAFDSASRLAHSTLAQLLIVVFVYTAGAGLGWHRVSAVDATSWYRESAGASELTWAGRWFLLVSLPLFQFFLFRSYFRLFIWGRLLWQVSRMELRLLPTHPDRAGGLGWRCA